jgi:hypothetical protein
MDLDGDDYEEPYIVTFDIATGRVRRIVARFLPSGVQYKNKNVYQIDPVKLFTKYGFIPSPDGGFYDLGLGAILGPINETVNSIVNQMLDAGTMATLGGGFVGRGFKSKAGPFTFQPNQWFPVDAPGDDLRKNILPLPVREPAAILFQLLGLLINYGERIVSATELQVGENIGQNTPAETARTMDQNGSRVYNAIYKRTWRAMRDEFRVQASLNGLFLEQDKDYTALKQAQMIDVTDYHDSGVTVKPAADPNIVSDGERVKAAQQLVTLSNQLPGFNRYQCTLRWLKALNVSGIEEIYPQPMGQDGKPAADFPPPGPDAKMLQVQINGQAQALKEKEFQAEQQTEMIKLQSELIKTQAEIENLRAQAELYIAQSKSEEVEPQIKLIYAQIEAAGSRKDNLMRLIELVDGSMHANADRKLEMLKEMNSGNSEGSKSNGNGMGSMAAAPPNPAISGALAGLNPGNSGFMAQ